MTLTTDYDSFLLKEDVPPTFTKNVPFTLEIEGHANFDPEMTNTININLYEEDGKTQILDNTLTGTTTCTGDDPNRENAVKYFKAQFRFTKAGSYVLEVISLTGPANAGYGQMQDNEGLRWNIEVTE